MSDRHRMLASTANFGGVERLTTFISTHRRWPSPNSSEGSERARQLGEYYRKIGRWPYRHDRDPASRTLERWLRTQRSLGRDNLSPELTAQLDEHAPGWDSPFRHTPPTRPQRTP